MYCRCRYSPSCWRWEQRGLGVPCAGRAPQDHLFGHTQVTFQSPSPWTSLGKPGLVCKDPVISTHMEASGCKCRNTLCSHGFICFYLFIQAVDVQTSRITLGSSHEVANPCGVPGNDRSFEECDTSGEFQQEFHANAMISSAQDDKIHLSCPFFSLKEKPLFTSVCHFLGMGFVICYAVKLHTDPLSNSCLEITTVTNCNSLQGSCQNPSGLFTLKLCSKE